MDNIKLTKLGTSVVIATEGDEENYTKKLFYQTEPNPTAGQDQSSLVSNANTTKILDILSKAERRITIDGYLCQGAIDSETHSAPSDKKTALRNMFFNAGVMTMTYEGSSVNINMDKLSVKRILTDAATLSDGEAEFSVKFTAVIGENMTSGG